MKNCTMTGNQVQVKILQIKGRIEPQIMPYPMPESPQPTGRERDLSVPAQFRRIDE